MLVSLKITQRGIKANQGESKGANKSSEELRGVKRCQEDSRGLKSKGVKRYGGSKEIKRWMMEGGQFGIWWCYVELGISMRLKGVYQEESRGFKRTRVKEIKRWIMEGGQCGIWWCLVELGQEVSRRVKRSQEKSRGVKRSH